MKAKKWIESRQEYIDYELPEGSALFETDMEKEVSCCSCGNKLKYGESYTSRKIHNAMGFGYAECDNCYHGNIK